MSKYDIVFSLQVETDEDNIEEIAQLGAENLSYELKEYSTKDAQAIIINEVEDDE